MGRQCRRAPDRRATHHPAEEDRRSGGPTCGSRVGGQGLQPAPCCLGDMITANLPLKPLQLGLARSGWAAFLVSAVWLAAVTQGMSREKEADGQLPQALEADAISVAATDGLTDRDLHWFRSRGHRGVYFPGKQCQPGDDYRNPTVYCAEGSGPQQKPSGRHGVLPCPADRSLVAEDRNAGGVRDQTGRAPRSVLGPQPMGEHGRRPWSTSPRELLHLTGPQSRRRSPSPPRS
jgi:hypothetical protein